MFGLTKKNPQNQENNKSDAQRLGQQKEFDLENMPIHTMKEDIENKTYLCKDLSYKVVGLCMESLISYLFRWLTAAIQEAYIRFQN